MPSSRHVDHSLVFLRSLQAELIRSKGQNSWLDGKILEACEADIENAVNVIEHYNNQRLDIVDRNVDEIYHDLLDDVLTTGLVQENRTGVQTLSLFGRQVKFDLAREFPILTTKKVFWKGIKYELLWMLGGNTNIEWLNENGVHIWDEWANKYGDLGPIYGQQWRDFGDPGTIVYDQIESVFEDLKKSPSSRRHVVSAWNPKDIDKMALPPCHCLFQFKVDTYPNTGRRVLHCHMYQRSADIFLGVPFNIASYALLTGLFAASLQYDVGTLTISYGDLHLYNNHIEQAQKQLKREPVQERPYVEIYQRENILHYRPDDIHLFNYNPHPVIKADVAV